ncbi:MAG: hypothetical protein ACFFCV_14755 [Promethearchaeota archaeon]
MAEDQLEQIEEVEEKEEKRKIKVISEIDDRIGIQGQAYMRGDLKTALAFAYEIIELAEPEDLQSFIKEQETLITRIKKIQQEREEKEKEKLRLEQARLRLEKIKKLKTELSHLEYSFNAGFNVEDFLKTEQTLEKAKKILSKLEDDNLRNKWDIFEEKHNKAKIRNEIITKAREIIEQSIVSKEEFQFDVVKPKLSNIINELKKNNIDTHLQELEYIQTDILNAEKTYLNVVKSIDGMINEIELYQKNRKFKNAISHCENLLKLAESIKKTDLVEKYSQILVKLKRDLSFEELKESVKKLNEEGLILLRKGEIQPSLEKFKMIKGTIDFYLKEA